MTGNLPKLEMSLAGERGHCPVSVLVHENPAVFSAWGFFFIWKKKKKNWPHGAAGGTLASWPGTKPAPPAAGAESQPLDCQGSPILCFLILLTCLPFSREAGFRSPNTPYLSAFCVVVFHFRVGLSRPLSTGTQVFLVRFPRTWWCLWHTAVDTDRSLA